MGIIFTISLAYMIIISIVGFSWYYGISPMPSSCRAREAIFSLLSESMGLRMVYELGSGWGHVAFPLAYRFPQTQVHAVEGSFFPWFISACIQQYLQRPNLFIQRKNFFYLSFQMVDGVICYLYPKSMVRLKNKFQKELRPGAFIITNTFRIPGWIPKKTLFVNDWWGSIIYLYIMT